MEYRPAIQSDLALLAAWNFQLIHDEGHRNPMTPLELEARMQSWLADEYQAIIFDVDAEPVAYALYHLDSSGIYLRQFFVDSERRRMGLGRQAIKLLLNEIWPAGLRVTLEVLVNNDRGQQFWRSLGFQAYAVMLEMQREGPVESSDS